MCGLRALGPDLHVESLLLPLRPPFRPAASGVAGEAAIAVSIARMLAAVRIAVCCGAHCDHPSPSPSHRYGDHVEAADEHSRWRWVTRVSEAAAAARAVSAADSDTSVADAAAAAPSAAFASLCCWRPSATAAMLVSGSDSTVVQIRAPCRAASATSALNSHSHRRRDTAADKSSTRTLRIAATSNPDASRCMCAAAPCGPL